MGRRTRRRGLRRIETIGAALAGVTLIAAGAAAVTRTAPDDATFTACLTDKGELLHVAVGDAPAEACEPAKGKKPGDLQITWNATGPAGATGPQGPAGPQGEQGPAGPAGADGTGLHVYSADGQLLGPLTSATLDDIHFYDTATGRVASVVAPTPRAATIHFTEPDCAGDGYVQLSLGLPGEHVATQPHVTTGPWFLVGDEDLIVIPASFLDFKAGTCLPFQQDANLKVRPATEVPAVQGYPGAYVAP